MEHFVTLFDSSYLPQGLALHQSMEHHVEDYCLWVLCVDEKTHEVLSKLNLPRTRLLRLSDCETPELLSVKSGRSVGEYCWTLTPFAPRFVFEADENVRRVTYIDADLWFRKDPSPIFEEFDESGKSVLITDHAYAPEYDQSLTSGQYCVQFMIFEKNSSEVVRKWWEERCIEWCFARFEDGKFGDQKYLDDWPSRFRDLVHVLGDKELLLAPWNVTRFPIGRAVAFHFHGVRMSKKKVALQGDYVIPHILRRILFEPYFEGLREALTALRREGFSHVIQSRPGLLPIQIFYTARRFKRRNWPGSISGNL